MYSEYFAASVVNNYDSIVEFCCVRSSCVTSLLRPINNRVDFLFLQESFLNDSYSSLDLEIQNYIVFRLDRAEHSTKKSGGDLVGYISSKYQVEYLTDWSTIDDNLPKRANLGGNHARLVK